MKIEYRDYKDSVRLAKQELGALGFWDGPEDPLFSMSFKEAVMYYQQTVGLDDDGVIGPLTREQMLNDELACMPPAENEPRLTPTLLWKNESPASPLTYRRSEVLHEASQHIGKQERPNGSNAGPEILAFMPPWARPDSGERGPAWCAFFVGYVIHEVFGVHALGGHYGGVRKLWKRADTSDCRTEWAVPGDAFVLLNADGRTGHTGFVRGVSPDGEHYYTIEGNCSNAVRAGRRRLDASSLAGFITFGMQAAEAVPIDFPDSVDLTRSATR